MRVENNIKFNEILSRMKLGTELFGETAGKKLEAEAKRNAPWTDRTGAARNSILGGFQWNGETGQVYISGNVYYFQYLELYHEKKWAILWPTIEKNKDDILKAFEKMLEKVK